MDFAESNRGSEEAPEHAVVLYLSEDEEYSSDDYELFTIDVSFALPPFGLDGAVLDTYIAMPTEEELAPGSYYVIGVIDPDDVVFELEEANNVTVLPALYVGPDNFDVVAVALTSELTGTQSPDEPFDVTLTIANASTTIVPEAEVAVYLSEDDTLDDSDILLACTLDPPVSLGVGAEEDFVISCVIPRVRGDYVLLAAVDPEDLLGDSARDDNVVAAADPITIDAASPDLEVTLVASSSYTVDWQGEITLSATVQNVGEDPSPATNLDFEALSSEPICSVSVPALDPGESAEVSRDCTLASDLYGTLALTARVDPDDEIFEVSEDNNSLASDTDLTVSAPDINLVAAGVGIVSGGASRSAGQDLDVYYEIQNDGADDAPPFRYVIYASVDSTITTSDTEFCIRDATTGLPAGTTTTGAYTTCTVPTMPTGDYYLGMIVDTEDDVPETDENDNVAVDSTNLFTMTE